MTTTKKRPPLVRYVSPFGSPAWMTREAAEKYRAEDDRQYEFLDQAGCLSEAERRVGPPRIELGPDEAARRDRERRRR